MLVIALGVLCYPLGLAAMKIGTDYDFPLRLVGLGAGAMVIGASWPLVRFGRRLRVAFGDWETIEADPRPPIVYLRPFEADGAQLVTGWTGHVRARPARKLLGETTYEQRFARALEGIAPFLAIANPSEGSLPEIGAVRLRAADSDWQQRVASLTSRAGSVILHAGESDGLAWEIEHLVAHGVPERLIIALPAPAGPARPSSEERYAAFVRRFATVFPRGLPDHAGQNQFLIFDADWNPHGLGDHGSRSPRAEAGSIGEQRALVLERLSSEFKVSPFPYWLRAGVGAMLAVVAALSLGTALYALLS